MRIALINQANMAVDWRERLRDDGTSQQTGWEKVHQP